MMNAKAPLEERREPAMGRSPGLQLWGPLSWGSAERGLVPRYALAVLAVLGVAGLRWLLLPVLSSYAPFLLFFPAVALAAWFGGLGPGLVATGLSAVAATTVIVAAPGPAVGRPPLAWLYVAFLLLGAGASWLCERLRQQRRRLEGLLEAERRAQAEIERAHRSRDELLSTVSHELRNPLNAIVGWAHVLQAAPADTEQVVQGVEAMLRSARAQTRLIEDLQDLSRILTGKLSLAVQSFELLPVVEAAVAWARPAADAKTIELRLAAKPTGSLQGDPERLQRALRGLFSNAVRSTPQRGAIEVSVRQAGGWAEVITRDSGAGVPAELLPRFFEQLWSWDGAARRRYGGSALDLAIARGVVELHGGSVRAESPGEGKGTTFILSLPAGEPVPATRVAPPVPEGAAEEPASLQGLRVLVVEDDPDTRGLIEMILAGHQAEVRSAASVAEAFERLGEFRPDVLLSDIAMPEADGYDLIRRLRALAPEQGGGVPAAALTALAGPEDQRRALEAGFQLHISKPVASTDLLLAVAGLAGRGSQTQH